MPDLTPPSAALLPSRQELRMRLAIALREVDLVRRLLRIANTVQPEPTPPPLRAQQQTGGCS